MDEWLVKPTNRQQIIDAVHTAQKAIAKRLAEVSSDQDQASPDLTSSEQT